MNPGSHRSPECPDNGLYVAPVSLQAFPDVTLTLAEIFA